jgi:hypothetical protein
MDFDKMHLLSKTPYVLKARSLMQLQGLGFLLLALVDASSYWPLDSWTPGLLEGEAKCLNDGCKTRGSSPSLTHAETSMGITRAPRTHISFGRYICISTTVRNPFLPSSSHSLIEACPHSYTLFPNPTLFSARRTLYFASRLLPPLPLHRFLS